MMLIFSCEWVEKLLINLLQVFVHLNEKVINTISVDNLLFY